MAARSIESRKVSIRSKLSYPDPMDGLYAMVNKHILGSDDFTFPSRAKRASCIRALFWTSVFHLTGYKSRIDFCNDVKGFLEPYTKDSASTVGIGFSLADKITGSFYSLVQLKYFFIYSAMCLDDPEQDTRLLVENTAGNFRLRGRDRILVSWISKYDSNPKCQGFIDFLVSRYSRFDTDDVSAYAANIVEKKFQFFYEKILRYVRSEIRRKMSFIPIFNVGVTKSDLESEMVARLLRTYYRIHPSQLTDTDIQKYLFSSVKNSTINLIEYYTTKKRSDSISVKNKDGTFKPAIHRTISEYVKRGNGGNDTDTTNGIFDRTVLKEQEAALPVVAHLSDLEYANMEIDSLIRTFRVQTMDLRALTIIMVLGRRFHRPFTHWLRSRKIIKKGENSIDFVTNVTFSAAKKTLAEYMDITVMDLNAIIAAVKEQVAREVK